MFTQRSIAPPQRHIRLEIDSRIISVPVPDDIYAYWHEQFVRPNPTPTQKKRYTTLMNLLRAAYTKGQKDGAATSAALAR
jgi:hypothetical protein